jgi:hypothetical protein
MFIDTATAKLHLRVTSTAEDALITIWISAAESAAVEFLNRYVYVDQDALDAAIAAAPAALTTATTAYDAAIAAAALIESEVERNMATFAAEDAYAKAQTVARMTHQGIVVNDNIKAAILLTLGHLYANREDVAANVTAAKLPMGACALLQPYRAAMGI